MHKIYVMDSVQKNDIVTTRIRADNYDLYKVNVIDICPDNLRIGADSSGKEKMAAADHLRRVLPVLKCLVF